MTGLSNDISSFGPLLSSDDRDYWTALLKCFAELGQLLFDLRHFRSQLLDQLL
jgi:hypothetical protein